MRQILPDGMDRSSLRLWVYGAGCRPGYCGREEHQESPERVRWAQVRATSSVHPCEADPPGTYLPLSVKTLGDAVDRIRASDDRPIVGRARQGNLRRRLRGSGRLSQTERLGLYVDHQI